MHDKAEFAKKLCGGGWVGSEMAAVIIPKVAEEEKRISFTRYPLGDCAFG